MIALGASTSRRFPRHSFRAASVTLKKIGQLSADASEYWDSQSWVPAISRDGSWRWSGKAWVPAGPPQGPGAATTTTASVATLRGLRYPVLNIRGAAASRFAFGVIALLVLVSVVAIQFALAGIVLPRNSWIAQLPWPSAIASPPPTDPTAASTVHRPAMARPHQVPLSPVRPSPLPPPPPPTCGAPSNPFVYDFCPPADLIYAPPPNFCQYFRCVSNFWTFTSGYIVQCVDGTFSHGGGRPLVCGHHRGLRRTLYS